MTLSTAYKYTNQQTRKSFLLILLLTHLLFPVASRSQSNIPNKNVTNSVLSNPCGVVARINPGNDSVIHATTIVLFTSASINATSYKFIIDSSPFPINTPVNYVFPIGLTEVKLVAYNSNCTDTAICYYFYPGTFPSDTANLKIYYGIPSLSQSIKDFIPVSSGGYFIGAERDYNSLHNIPTQGYVIKIKESGCIEWSRAINYSLYSKLYNVAESANGNFFITAEIDGAFSISKIDHFGNLIWSKKLITTGGSQMVGYGIKELPDGGLVATGTFVGSTHLAIIRLDNNGNILWQRDYDKENQTQSFGAFRNFLLKNNAIYIGGFISYQENGNSIGKSLIMKLDYVTGQTIWSKYYTSPNGAIALSDMHDVDTTMTLNAAAGTGIPNAYTIASIIKLDTAGNVINSTLISEPDEYYPTNSHIIPLPEKKCYVLSSGFKPLPLQPYISYQTKLVKLDSNYNILWSKHYAAVNFGQFFYPALGPDQSLVIAGNEYGQGYSYYASSSGKIAIKKFDSLGGDPNNTCNFSIQPMSTAPITITPQSFIWNSESTTNNTSINFPLDIFTFYPEYRYKCPDYVDSCSFLEVTGPASICNLNDDYTYKIHKNRGCGQPTQWDLGANLNIIQQTDSSVTVRFPSFGTYKIAATLSFGCSPLKDSLVITVASSSPPLNLGNDTTLCPDNSMVIHAGSSFFNYLWQDGSTDSLLTINSPGQYWVMVTDSCQNILKDTINISWAPPIPLSIGPDKSKCNNDTLHLNAPSGFLNYTWSPNYNISSTTSQNVIINPSIDTLYTIKAEKTLGCFGFDTIYIAVFHSPPIYLGADTNFCLGDSVLLDAGAGFNQYLWNNGITTQKRIINAEGIYSVVGIDPNGCKSFDTLEVITVYSLPVINLNPDSTLCIGETRILDAGPGFSSYVWNDATTSQTIAVNTTGIYSVIVIDRNGCKGTDTTKITRILPLPSGFLPADTAICSYGSLLLQPISNYNSYLWNTNSLSRSITVTNSGTYWLQVADNNNCIGVDTIVVLPKECMKGFYIPNSFTPNGDGRNDIFRPLLFGKVNQYHFWIYNRWGQIVFETTELTKGWNGMFANTTQNNDIFIWMCKFQFEGEEVKMEKGTVMVIK